MYVWDGERKKNVSVASLDGDGVLECRSGAGKAQKRHPKEDVKASGSFSKSQPCQGPNVVGASGELYLHTATCNGVIRSLWIELAFGRHVQEDPSRRQ